MVVFWLNKVKVINYFYNTQTGLANLLKFMANPIPYNQLFDIDGLKLAIKDCEGTSNEFNAAVQEDFKRTQSAASALRKELEAINAAMNGKTIKLTDEQSQEQVIQFAQQIANLTKQFKDQQAAITAMNGVLNSNKVAIADAKTAQAQYTAELAKGKSDQQAIRVQIAQTALEMKQLALANKTATQAQQAATGSYKEAQQRLTALGNAIRQTKDGFTSTSPALQAQIEEYNKLNTGLKNFDAQMGNHQRNVGNYQSALSGLGDELKGYAAGLFSIAAVMEVVNKTFDAALETDATRTSLGYILGSTELADEKLRALKETSNRLGLEFTSTAKAYALFTGAAKASNFSLDEADKIFNSVSRAVGVLHLPAEQASSAFYALQEMISKGTIQSKELQRQLGQAIPGSVAIMADALGVSVQKLHDMEKSGELLTSEVLPKFAAQLDKTFAPGVSKVDSLSASVNNLKNSFSEAVDEDTAIAKFFKTVLNGINEIFSSITTTVNSTSWQEFWKRALPHAKDDNSADVLHNLQAGYNNSAGALQNDTMTDRGPKFDNATVLKRVNDIQIALDEARKTYEGLKTAVSKGQVEQKGDLTLGNVGGLIDNLKTTIELYKRDYPAAFAVVAKGNKEVTDEQLTSIAEIRKRITELSKLPGSATKGSDVNNRIDALKKRLHDLAPDLKAAKDGFAILEEQINKTLLALQDNIVKDYSKNQGVSTARTLQLAKSYETLTEKLQAYKDSLAGVQSRAAYKGPLTASVPKVSNEDFAAGLAPQLIHADNNAGISKDELELDKVVKRYADANVAIIDLYKAQVYTKEQMNEALTSNEFEQVTEEYQLNYDILQRKLANEKFVNGESSKAYADLLAQKAKLDEAYATKNLANLEKLLQAQKDHLLKVGGIFDTLQTNAGVVGSETDNPGLGRLAGDATTAVKNITLSQQPGAQAMTDAEKFQTAAQLGIDATQTYTDFAINASKQRMSALQQEMAWEIQGAGTNSLAKQKIEKEYTDKIKAEQTKQAKLKKAAAAVEIILNTAVAISKTLATTAIFGIPLIPVIAALGAVELGIVLASPIPQFEGGRDSGPATIAEVNERGPEALVKNGRVRFANKGKRGYTYLQKDEKVIRADETQRWVDNQVNNADNVSQSRQIYDTYVATHSGAQSIDYDRMAGAVSTAVSKLPFEQNVWDERGHSQYRRTQNARIKSVRDRNRI